MAPEIDRVLKNICLYLKPDGVFACIYNYSEDAFSKKWLTPLIFEKKVLQFLDIEMKWNEENCSEIIYYYIFKKINKVI